MNWYKTSRQSAWKTKTYPEKAVNRSLWNFYNWLKAKNVIVTFYHGTSDLAYSLIGKTGWISPPTWRGREKEEGRYSTDIHDEAEKGLDKLFFTKRFEQASNYAERDAKTWNSNTERVLETKKSLNIDPKIIANPLVIKIALPLHDLDEIKGNVFGTYIYNESGMDDEIKSAITSFESNDVKLKEILDVVNGSYDKSNEFTVKGGLPVSRKEGFAHVSLLGVDDYVELLTKGVTSYEKIPQEIRDKYPERIEETYVVGLENKLKNTPWYYETIPQEIKNKYPERIEEAYVVGLENYLKESPSYYLDIPQEIKNKYPERIEEAYLVGSENQLKNYPWNYASIPQEIKNKYPERIEEAYLVGSENYLKKYPWYYDGIPQWIRDKYPERIEEAYLVGLENYLKEDPTYYGGIPQWVREKYPERFAKYAPKLANKHMNWYKQSQIQPALPNVDWKTVKETVPTPIDYDSLEDELEDASGLFGVRQAAEHWGYDVNIVEFDHVSPVAVLTKGNETLVVDDFGNPSVEKAAQWVYNIAEWRLTDYVDIPDEFEDFWAGVGIGYKVYHGTNAENAEGIMIHGLQPRDKSKGISNRGDGPGVYTSAEYETAAYSYDVVIEIDVSAMKADGFTVPVRGEGPIEEGKIIDAIAWRLGLRDFHSEIDQSDGLAEDTVVFQGTIPPKYLKVIEK